MRANPKSPSYLVRNPYSYCFRMVVPKDLQKFIGKREFPEPSVARNQSHPATKCCFDTQRLTGLWNHGGSISTYTGLAEQVLMTRTIDASNTHP